MLRNVARSCDPQHSREEGGARRDAWAWGATPSGRVAPCRLLSDSGGGMTWGGEMAWPCMPQVLASEACSGWRVPPAVPCNMLQGDTHSEQQVLGDMHHGCVVTIIPSHTLSLSRRCKEGSNGAGRSVAPDLSPCVRQHALARLAELRGALFPGRGVRSTVRWVCVVQECMADRDRDVQAAKAEARLVQSSLEQQLKRVESELTACQDSRRRLEAAAAAAAAPAPPGRSPRQPNGRHAPPGAGGASSAGVRESLSLDDLHRASSAAEGGGSAPSAPYVRGVVMKLLGAIAEGRASDRDALLPVVGMLLGASPAECEQLQHAFNGSTLYEMLGYK